MYDIIFRENTNREQAIYLCDSQLMRRMDEDTVRRKNITFAQLMQSAAASLHKYITETNDINGTNGINKINDVVIICGKGNNGGDGRILALLLSGNGIKVSVIETAEVLTAHDLSDEILQKIFSQSDIIIDAVFGTGFTGELPRNVSRILKFANSGDIKARRIAIDIPSGVDANDGTADINAFRADETLTFEFIKRGLISYPGAEYAGKIVVLPIGFPNATRDLARENAKSILLSWEYIKRLLPEREKNTNKGDFGRLLAVCGSKNMTGAAFLSAMGALRTGVGLLYLAAPDNIIPVLQSKLNEPVFVPLDFSEVHINATLAELKQNINIYDAVLFGCGIGSSTDVRMMLDEVIKNHDKTIIFDADGINILCENIDILNEINARKILTPHPGEMARLCNTTVEAVQKNRINIASDFAKKYNCTLVLKGALTVIAESNGDIYINPTGNPGMARGGSGDILAGMIASYAAQGIKAADAACLGVYLHGLAGDIARRRLSELGMLPTDLLDILPEIQSPMFEVKSEK